MNYKLRVISKNYILPLFVISTLIESFNIIKKMKLKDSYKALYKLKQVFLLAFDFQNICRFESINQQVNKF